MHSAWPKRRARILVRRFRECFPELIYEIDLEIRIVNAQATLDGDRRVVRVYGGLVRHRKLNSAGLAVALAHETGHHLGGPPLHRVFRWLSSEERATEWAMTRGLRTVFGRDRADAIAKKGTMNLQLVRRH
jgi:Zn-dependent protease with chaperone function